MADAILWRSDLRSISTNKYLWLLNAPSEGRIRLGRCIFLMKKCLHRHFMKIENAVKGEKYMQSSTDLRSLLNRIDHRGYPAYKDTKGMYQFPGYVLSIDHVQGDPFASPSRDSPGNCTETDIRGSRFRMSLPGSSAGGQSSLPLKRRGQGRAVLFL